MTPGAWRGSHYSTSFKSLVSLDRGDGGGGGGGGRNTSMAVCWARCPA